MLNFEYLLFCFVSISFLLFCFLFFFSLQRWGWAEGEIFLSKCCCLLLLFLYGSIIWTVLTPTLFFMWMFAIDPITTNFKALLRLTYIGTSSCFTAWISKFSETAHQIYYKTNPTLSNWKIPNDRKGFQDSLFYTYMYIIYVYVYVCICM